jgi:hypothetical protein
MSSSSGTNDNAMAEDQFSEYSLSSSDDDESDDHERSLNQPYPYSDKILKFKTGTSMRRLHRLSFETNSDLITYDQLKVDGFWAQLRISEGLSFGCSLYEGMNPGIKWMPVMQPVGLEKYRKSGQI